MRPFDLTDDDLLQGVPLVVAVDDAVLRRSRSAFEDVAVGTRDHFLQGRAVLHIAKRSFRGCACVLTQDGILPAQGAAS